MLYNHPHSAQALPRPPKDKHDGSQQPQAGNMSDLSRRQRLRYKINNFGYRLLPTVDGYPLPPGRLIELVIGTREVAWYQLGGMFMNQAMGTLLRRHGRPFESHDTILDFGCGCGRLIRWLGALKGRCEIWGTDYNPDLIAWCERNLSSLASFKVNGSDPPLDFEDAKFSLVYSYSVLTHLSADRQEAWFAELSRVTRPGGLLCLTVHGQRCAMRMDFSAEQMQKLESDGLVVYGEERSGENYCGAYHSEGFMRGLDRHGLELLEFISGRLPRRLGTGLVSLSQTLSGSLRRFEVCWRLRSRR